MKQKLTLFLLTLVMLVLMIPSQIFGATKYFSVNRADEGTCYFQENKENSIDNSLDVMFYSNGKYKFIIKTKEGFIINDELVKELNLKEVPLLSKGDVVRFNLFTKDYTPKEYHAVLKGATIQVYDSNSNKLDEFPLLKYKEYIQFTENNVLKVTLNEYISGDNDINTGVDLTASWELEKEKPQELILKREDINMYQNYDISSYKKKDKVEMSFELRYNGEYVIVLHTDKNEYAQKIKFTELEDNIVVTEEPESTSVEKGENLDNSNIKIEVSGIPNKKLEEGHSFTLVIGTNVETSIDMSGRVDSSFRKKHKFNITENGTYYITALSEAGKSAEKKVTINCFKEAAPSGIQTFSRNDYWSGTPETRDYGETLVQTGKYSYTLIIIAGILLLLGGLIIAFVLPQKKESDSDTNDK